MKARLRSIGARWILPVEGPPVPEGRLDIEDGRIAAIHPNARASADLDLGNAAIVPGFVNCHTHLELASIPTPDPSSGPEDEVEWLSRVIAQRRGGSLDALRENVALNLLQAVASGTTLVADTTTNGLSWPLVAEAPIRAVVFAELIGLKRERGIQTVHDAFAWLGSIRPENQVVACARPGLSPHAPYSTAGWVYERAAGAGVPLSTHLAEMPEELELLRAKTGKLRAFLENLGAWDDAWIPLSSNPGDYVRKGILRKSDWLIAHGTYLDPGDFWRLRPESAPGDQRVAVAYCPRTTARFGHGPHPYRAILESGGIVCIGTDSLASTPTLSVLDELRFLRRLDPSLSGRLLLTMGTLFGAWALRAETVVGSLRPGKAADLAVIRLPDRGDGDDPHDLVFDAEGPVVATVFEGAFVAGGWAEV